MKRLSTFLRLTLALALTLGSLSFGATAASASTPYCIMACTNIGWGGVCSRIQCRCGANGGAVVRCTQCSDNDYTCWIDGFPV
ncbi:MAG: hypothetical protein AAGN66_24270 [Acidobacteriota bacterium]